ncbi:MAG: RodZ domain-containing protein [Pseudomonadota bacterium]
MTNQAADPQDWNDYNDLAVGEILRRTRLHYGQTLEQVEFALRIRASQLHALEQGDVSQLPGRVYAIGFVRTYSEYLGLDADRMVHLFKNQSVGNKTKADLSFPTITNDSQMPSAPYVLGGLGGCLLLIFIGLSLFGQPKNAVDDIPMLSVDPDVSITEAPPIGIEQTVQDTVVITEDMSEQASLLVPEPQAAAVVIQTMANSWVEIRDGDGKVILSQILKKGDEYTVPDGKGYTMTTGNAGGMKLIVNGEEIPPLGRPAQVRRNISLSPQDLLSTP